MGLISYAELLSLVARSLQVLSLKHGKGNGIELQALAL
jgi:hypothetical protein